MEMKMIEMNRNYMTGGIYAIFLKDNSCYYADLSNTFDRGIECMIFPHDLETNKTDWGEVFVRYPEKISEKVLMEVIEEFVRER